MYSKEELIKQFFHLFKIHGFKGITVDDLAGETGMSKKTLYEYFKNKDEIVILVIKYFINELEELFIKSIQEGDDIIESIIYIHRNLISYLSAVNPVFFHSLKRQRAVINPLFNRFNEEIYYPELKKLFNKGKTKGLFRDDMQVEHLLHSQNQMTTFFLYEQQADSSFSGLNTKELLYLIVNNIRGATTPEGYKILDEKKDFIERITR